MIHGHYHYQIKLSLATNTSIGQYQFVSSLQRAVSKEETVCQSDMKDKKCVHYQNKIESVPHDLFIANYIRTERNMKASAIMGCLSQALCVFIILFIVPTSALTFNEVRNFDFTPVNYRFCSLFAQIVIVIES